MSKSSTQETTNEPPEWAKPLFEQSARDAQKLYNSDNGFHVWQGPSVVQPSRWTQMGMQGLLSEALGGNRSSYDVSAPFLPSVKSQNKPFTPQPPPQQPTDKTKDDGTPKPNHPATITNDGYVQLPSGSWQPKGGGDSHAGGRMREMRSGTGNLIGDDAAALNSNAAGPGAGPSGSGMSGTTGAAGLENNPVSFFNNLMTGQGLPAGAQNSINFLDALGRGTGLPGAWNPQMGGANSGYNDLLSGTGLGSAQQGRASGIFGDIGRTGGVTGANAMRGLMDDARNPMSYGAREMGNLVATGGMGNINDLYGNAMGQAGGISDPSRALGGIASGRDGVDPSLFNAGDAAARQGVGMSRDLVGGIARGRDGISDAFGAIGRDAGGPGAAEKYMTAAAQGKMLNGNPYFEDLLQRNIDKASDQQERMFGAGGRYGSGANQQVLGQVASDMRLQGLSENYGRERELMFEAQKALEDAENAGFSQRLAAAQGSTGVQGQNIANRMGAAGQMLDQQNMLASGLYGSAAGRAGIEAGNLGRMIDASGQMTNARAAESAARQGLLSGMTDARNQTAQNQMGAIDQQRNAMQMAVEQQRGLLSGAADIQNMGTQNRLAGAGGLADLGSQLAGQQATGAAGLAGLGRDYFSNQNQNTQTQMDALAQSFGMGQQGIANQLSAINQLPTIQENRVFDENLLMQAGAMQDQMRQAQLNDQISRFYANDMRDWTKLGGLQAAAQGAAGPYGQSVTTMKQPFNPLGMLGGLFSMFL